MFNREDRSAKAGVRVQFSGVEGHGIPIFRPNEDIIGVVEVLPDKVIECRGVEIQLKWRTEGKGDTDQQVIDFDSVHVTQITPDEPLIYPFQFKAPDMPWSYEGELIRIVWAVEVKIDVEAKLDIFNLMNIQHKAEFSLRPD